jgi:hypothetical protein
MSPQGAARGREMGVIGLECVLLMLFWAGEQPGLFWAGEQPGLFWAGEQPGLMTSLLMILHGAEEQSGVSD